MSTTRNDRIYILRDTTEYIYQWQARYYDDDDYDHHGYTILPINNKKYTPGIIKPIQR